MTQSVKKQDSIIHNPSYISIMRESTSMAIHNIFHYNIKRDHINKILSASNPINRKMYIRKCNAQLKASVSWSLIEKERSSISVMMKKLNFLLGNWSLIKTILKKILKWNFNWLRSTTWDCFKDKKGIFLLSSGISLMIPVSPKWEKKLTKES